VSQHDLFLTCQDYFEGLADFLDDEQPRSVRRAFSVHRLRCTPCRRYTRTYSLTIALSRRTQLDDVAPDPPESLVWTILDASFRRDSLENLTAERLASVPV
jgi:hypothetical protein